MTSLEPERPTTSSTHATAWALADAVLILAFAGIGRLSHGENLGGLLVTAWPFLTGGLVGWLAARAWRRPSRILPSGVPVWLCTVVVGMVLRALTGAGVAVSFVIVALIVTGVFLIGARAAAKLVGHRAA